jgi:hypothetical protein
VSTAMPSRSRPVSAVAAVVDASSADRPVKPPGTSYGHAMTTTRLAPPAADRPAHVTGR